MKYQKLRRCNIKNCSNWVTFFCNLLFDIFSIRYLLEHCAYLKISQIPVPMITLIGRPGNIYRSTAV